LFNGETITPQILLFAAAVVATVAISTRTRRRATPSNAVLPGSTQSLSSGRTSRGPVGAVPD
jgi:hypothetical protein